MIAVPSGTRTHAWAIVLVMAVVAAVVTGVVTTPMLAPNSRPSKDAAKLASAIKRAPSGVERKALNVPLSVGAHGIQFHCAFQVGSAFRSSYVPRPNERLARYGVDGEPTGLPPTL